jgi:regulator of replication initiation timing
METTETPQEVYKTATEALENIGNMAQEMEDRYEEKIEILKLQFEDACAQAEKYIIENKNLKIENDELVHEVGSLIVEAQEARRSFTAFQIAVSLLVFVYGMMYGTYFKTC